MGDAPAEPDPPGAMRLPLIGLGVGGCGDWCGVVAAAVAPPQRARAWPPSPARCTATHCSPTAHCLPCPALGFRQTPVFGDVDGDGELEVVVTTFRHAGRGAERGRRGR